MQTRPEMLPTRRQFLASSLAAALMPAPAPEPMIDAHVHVFRRDPAFPYAAQAKPPAEDAPVETLIDLMRSNAVTHTVLIQVIHYRWDNRYLASVLQRYPRLFHGVCRVDPQDPAAPDHLSELTEQGFRGVRLSPAATPEGDWIRGPLMAPLWKRCAELRVPMTVLTTPTRLADLVPWIEANPTLDVVIDHMGECPLNHPDQLKMLTDLARYPRVFVKISGLWEISKEPYPYRDTHAQLGKIRDAFGATRLMTATNWPVSAPTLSYAQAVELPRRYLPLFNDTERRQILSGTVQRLWPFR